MCWPDFFLQITGLENTQYIFSLSAIYDVVVEQRTDPDPLDVVSDALFGSASCEVKDQLIERLDEDCVLNNNASKTAINDLVRAEKKAMAAAVAEEEKEEVEI